MAPDCVVKTAFYGLPGNACLLTDFYFRAVSTLKGKNCSRKEVTVMCSDAALEKAQEVLPAGRHRCTSIFNSVLRFCEFFVSWSLGAESLIGIGAQGGISCCLLLNLHWEADGMSLCADLGIGLKTSFQWSHKHTRQPTCSPLGPQATWTVVAAETWAELWLQWQRDLRSGWTTRDTKFNQAARIDSSGLY